MATPDVLQWCMILGNDPDMPTTESTTESPSPSSLPLAIIAGDYKTVLESPLAKAVFGTDLDNSSTAVVSLNETLDLSTFLSHQIQQLKDYSTLDLLAVGVATLYGFVQAGWTGPDLKISPIDLLPGLLKEKKEALEKKSVIDMSAGGEDAYHLTPELLFLQLAKILLVDQLETVFKKDTVVAKTAPWWALRTLFLQQRILDGAASSIQQEMYDLVKELEGILATESANPIGLIESVDQKEAATRLWIEKGLIYHWYTEDNLAYEAFQIAQEKSGFRFKVTGALGKRTRFQQFDVSQLVVVAESSTDMIENRRKTAYVSQAGSNNEDGTPRGPKNLTHNDDTVMEKIQFSELSEMDRACLGDLDLDPSKEIQDLNPIDHALLLAFCLNIKNTNPAHGITVEQMFPYVTRVLETPNNWTVYTMALLLRSRLEADKSRTVERGALQLQALVEQTKIEDDTSTVRERMHHFFSIALPSKWELEKELAEAFMSLGVVRSALDIFERLELWEDVIACHQFLSQSKKARDLCMERLELEPNSAKLWCILGDLDQEPEHFRKSWEVSGHRFARAMRSLGAYHFKRDEFAEAMKAYQLALKINPLFDNSWFVLGCAAMQEEDWDVAIEAFTRVVSLDPANGEAWNNLAAIHMRRNNNLDAQHALRQALKEKRESWKIWSNYMYCSLDVGDFTEAIRAMGTVVELRWKNSKEDRADCVDIVILDRIVQGVTRDLKDLYSRSVVFQATKVEELLLGITNRIATDPKIWKICGKFYFWQKNYKECLECHLKAYRCVIHDPKVETEEKVFESVAEAALEMVDWYRNLGDMEVTFLEPDVSGATEGKQVTEIVAKDWAYRSKQMIKSLMAKTRDPWGHTATFDKLTECLEELKNEK